MGCSCSKQYDFNLPKLENNIKFVSSKKQYTIINVIIDELFNRAEKVSRYVRAKRLWHCYPCQHLFIPTKQCKKCGCFVRAKVVYEKSSCPVGKW